jgi:hypothetical protein
MSWKGNDMTLIRSKSVLGYCRLKLERVGSTSEAGLCKVPGTRYLTRHEDGDENPFFVCNMSSIGLLHMSNHFGLLVNSKKGRALITLLDPTSASKSVLCHLSLDDGVKGP